MEILKTFDLEPIDAVMIPICALLFVFVWRLFAKNIFEPYMKLFEAREAATVGAEENALAITNEAAEISQKYENQILDARVAAMKHKLSLLNSAKTEGAKIIDEAEGKAQEAVRAVRWEIAQKRHDLRAQALKEVDAMTEEVVRRVKSPASNIIGNMN